MEKTLEDIKNEILKTTSDIELILVYGSYAFGKMHKYSDIDIAAFTRKTPARKSIFRFADHEKARALLTIHFKQFSKALGDFKKPEEWIWDAAYKYAKVLFDRNHNMDKLKAELDKHKVTSEDFFQYIPREASEVLEYVGKLKNAYRQKDALNVLYAARTIAEICYNILRPFNPVWLYTSESEIYPTFLSLKNKPKHYVDDFKICSGLTLKKRSTRLIFNSAMRLTRETTDFLRRNLDETRMKDKEFLKFLNSKEYTDFLR
jgi:predicted nucleotidyltransferase